MSADARLTEKLSELGLQMPAAPDPKGLYKPLVLVGDRACTAGHLPVRPDGSLVTGRLGEDLDQEAGYEAAVLAGLNILATLKKHLGSLDRVRRVIKVFGIVNCTSQFDQQPAVINGCSQLLADVFGPEAGIGVRSAIGADSLPLGVPVEIEAIFEVE